MQCRFTFGTLQLFLMLLGQGLWCCIGFGAGFNGQIRAPVPCFLSGLFYWNSILVTHLFFILPLNPILLIKKNINKFPSTLKDLLTGTQCCQYWVVRCHSQNSFRAGEIIAILLIWRFEFLLACFELGLFPSALVPHVS